MDVLVPEVVLRIVSVIFNVTSEEVCSSMKKYYCINVYVTTFHWLVKLCSQRHIQAEDTDSSDDEGMALAYAALY
jgi:hypothetical protein